jgi:hypothetical protein
LSHSPFTSGASHLGEFIVSRPLCQQPPTAQVAGRFLEFIARSSGIYEKNAPAGEFFSAAYII